MIEHLAHSVQKQDFGNDNLLILLGMRVRSHAETMLQSAAQKPKGEFSRHGRLQADSLPGMLSAFLENRYFTL